ncbi:hypothetical protein CL176_03420 [Suicoccus acidiformans]|uniref:bis(5'-nucleosyl)-tetraphosphatase (symmetrical) n=1 Tax=Suicoccus acidiformans TaxID=2036206 RepID=A0A347WJ98_9LACT|nr:bis(5'-nucleosyl)-tetraphosphatase (symmetrical) YqeK [Suicoccus acidiformans]AXY25155.1 hypothetical protein CL176_03420 [Suicoccus acidiformans]
MTDYHILSIDRDTLLADLSERLSVKRFEHVLRVEATALELAEVYQVDFERTSVAALMHDYAKEMPDAAMRELALAYTGDPLLGEFNGNLWHGPAAAEIARSQFGCQDVEVLKAIAEHTIGALGMSVLSKVIFVADYIEPKRKFKAVDKARKVAFEDLDQAVLLKMAGSIRKLIKDSELIYLPSIENYNAFVKKTSSKTI